ncbi:MAG: efflux RND transporter periplasmic adaptor subunit [Magnetococcales bacterium]|nr:efflux RND transporter periplasmic adaptor subunit [Magnetococcales bacterium]
MGLKDQSVTDNREGGDRRGSVDRCIAQLTELRRFTGPPDAFWGHYLTGVAGLCVAIQSGILIRQGDAEVPWQTLRLWHGGARGVRENLLPPKALLDRTIREGLVLELAGAKGGLFKTGLLLLRMNIGPGQPDVVLFLVPRYPLKTGEEGQEWVYRLKLVADIPALYQQSREYHQSRRDVVRIAEVLDLIGRLQVDKTFSQVTLTLCNELATRFECNQVGLGWLDEEGYVELKSISHMVKFDRKMVTAQSLESAMEESLDQDAEILWPPDPQRSEITLAHGSYAQERSLQYLVSLPLRHGGTQVGALTCERRGAPFSEFDVWSLRLFADHTVLRLLELKKADLWMGARVVDFLTDLTAPLWGRGHVVVKFLGVLGTLLLLFSLLSFWPYRVEAPFLLKTDDSYTLPAPFDGFIEEVVVKEGDRVTKNRTLATLDSRELQLEESSTLAEISRYALEAEKARSEGALAEMRIAQAMQTQMRAKHGRIAYQIERAHIRAPMAGIIVEGDLQKLLGAPVRRGDPLFRVASLTQMHVMIDVDERDIHEIRVGMDGEIAFIGRPDQYYLIRVARINPVAEVRDGRNVFLVRAEIKATETADWWRPGMSGVVKLDVGQRRIIWIFTHRTVEFLRMLVWW